MNVSTVPVQPLATEATRLRAHLRALVRRFSVAERADVECCGMTVAQAAAVEALRGGPLRFGELGRRLGVAPSTLTRNVRRLEEVGLVARENDSQDGRASRVQLTTQGEGTAARLEEIEERFAAAVLSRLPEARRAQALDSFGELLEAVRAETEACCAGAYDHLLDGAQSCCVTATAGKG